MKWNLRYTNSHYVNKPSGKKQYCRMVLLVGLLGCLFIGCQSNHPVNDDFQKFLVTKVTYPLQGMNEYLDEPKNYRMSFVTKDNVRDSVLAIWFPRLSKIFYFDAKNGNQLSVDSLLSFSERDILSYYIDADGCIWCTPVYNELIKMCNGEIHHYYVNYSISNSYYAYAYGGYVSLYMQQDECELAMPPQYEMVLESGNIPVVGKFEIVGDSVNFVDTLATYPNNNWLNTHYSQVPITAFIKDTTYYIFEDDDRVYMHVPQSVACSAVVNIKDIYPDWQRMPFDRDSVYDINYIMRNGVLYPRPVFFIYDEFRKVFYLGIKEKQDFVDKDGIHVNNSREYPFVVIILNNQFQKMGAVRFPKGRFMLQGRTHVSKEGLWMMLKPQETIGYEIFNFDALISSNRMQ